MILNILQSSPPKIRGFNYTFIHVYDIAVVLWGVPHIAFIIWMSCLQKSEIFFKCFLFISMWWRVSNLGIHHFNDLFFKEMFFIKTCSTRVNKHGETRKFLWNTETSTSTMFLSKWTVYVWSNSPYWLAHNVAPPSPVYHAFPMCVWFFLLYILRSNSPYNPTYTHLY